MQGRTPNNTVALARGRSLEQRRRFVEAVTADASRADVQARHGG